MSRLSDFGKATAAILKNIMAPQVGRDEMCDAIGYIENAGVPSGVVPTFIGQRLFDTSNNTWYKSFGVSAGNWSAMGDPGLTAAELDVLDGALATNLVAGKAAITGTGGALTLGGALTAVGSVIIGSADLNEADMEKLDGITDGTGAASKAVVLDSGEDFVWPNTGVLTLGVLATAAEAAEHGAGAIGTAVAPVTYRWIEHGVIVTQTKFDLTGLRSVATANDVIGLQAGGAAFIGRNVVATNGVIFKVELSCLETPTGGDNDVNVVANASATLVYDDAGGTTYLSNSGDLLVGQTIQNLLPGLTANDYFYLTAGTGDTLGDYTAGMYVLTTYGHPVL